MTRSILRPVLTLAALLVLGGCGTCGKDGAKGKAGSKGAAGAKGASGPSAPAPFRPRMNAAADTGSTWDGRDSGAVTPAAAGSSMSERIAGAEVPAFTGAEVRTIAKDMSSLPATALSYATDRRKPRTIRVRKLEPDSKSTPLIFEADMDIVADGAGGAWRGDATGQPRTALRYKDGGSLNPTELPFIVLPIGFERPHPGVRLGDYAAVMYKGRTAFAIYGDRGPRGVLGEGSIALARALGINADPNKGGVSGGVTYIVFPGSRGERHPRTAAETAANAKPLLDALLARSSSFCRPREAVRLGRKTP